MNDSENTQGGGLYGLAAVRADMVTFRSMLLHRIVLAALLSALVMVGLFLTNYSPQRARFYWTAMFPAFGLVGLWHSLRAHRRLMALWRIVLRDALHWLGAMAAVRIVFLQLEWGQMSADSVALMTVVLLAVTCFLAGVHLDPSFIWVSALLAGCAIVGTNVEGYLWVIIVAALILLAIALFVLAMIHRAGAKTPAGGQISP